MDFIAFDLETTGTHPQEDEIVEIGAVRFVGLQAQEGFGKLINPGIVIPPDAQAVNGISDEMVAGKPKIEEVLGDFADFCGDLPLVAHNAPFDYKFLSAAIDRAKGAAPKGVVLDTLPLARKIFPRLPNYKLWTLVRHFNFPSAAFHRAEEDSSYCGMLFAKIIETLQQRQEACSVEALLELIGKEPLMFPQYKDHRDQLDLF
jgi:DNA polymerase-3 subunit epsilon